MPSFQGPYGPRRFPIAEEIVLDFKFSWVIQNNSKIFLNIEKHNWDASFEKV